MDKVKNQHFVAQSYLRRFAADDEDQVWVFDKFNQQSYKTSVRNVGSKRFFYDFDHDLVEQAFQRDEVVAQMRAEVGESVDLNTVRDIIQDQVIEKTFLRQIDSNFPALLDHIFHELATTRRNKKPLGRKVVYLRERRALAYFTFVQMVRTREFREIIRDAFESDAKRDLPEFIRTHLPGESPDDYGVYLPEERLPILQAGMLLDPKVAGMHVDTMTSSFTWVLGVNQTPIPLYTSDVPVVRHLHDIRLLRESSVLDSPSAEIVFPLSPEVILIMRERSYFKDWLRLDGRAVPLKEEGVRMYNALQVLHSQRQLYSRTDNFDHARKLCSRYPEVCKDTITSNRDFREGEP